MDIILQKTPLEEVAEVVETLRVNHNPLLWEESYQELKSRFAQNEIEYVYFRMAKSVAYAEGLLVAQDGKGAEKLLREYVEATIHYMDCMYQEQAFAENAFILEDYERAALQLVPIFDENIEIDAHEAIACMKRGVEEDVRLGDNIKVFAEHLGKMAEMQQ